MMSLKVFTVLLSIILLVSGEMQLVVYDNLVDCDEYKGEKQARMVDYSTLKLIYENDTHTFINGSMKFLQELNAPWGVHVYLEHKVQGEWKLQMFDRKYKDFCFTMTNPLEPTYPYIKDMKKCPLHAGDEWFFNMTVVELKPELMRAIPPHYVGEWRATFIGVFRIDGVDKYECKRGFGDFFEI